MAFSDYQQTIAWHSALELGPKLNQLAEELPIGEQNGLAQALLNLAVDLPTSIALDIQTGTTSRNAVLIRLQTVLELTARIYPALDNIMVETALADRIERFTGSNFMETIPAPTPANREQPDTDEPIPRGQMLDAPPIAPFVPVPAIEDPNMPSLIAQAVAPQVLSLDTSGTHISLTPNEAPAEAPANVPTNIQ